ncbi:MAG: outer membrane protein assembly factor BamD [Acidobacteria bacterium]|nr:outer membrane protein assembly factor BamD [Acidobacteriota bacterium]
MALVKNARVLRRVAVPLLLVGLAGCHRGDRRELLGDNEVLFRRAQESIERRRFLEAIRLLGDIGMVTPVPEEMDPELKLLLADAYFYQGDTISLVEAQNRYEQFVSFYPLHPRARYARYQVGACLLAQAEEPQNDQEYARRARDHFEAMMRELPPNDPWLPATRSMAAQAQGRLAEHEWLVAKFYFDLKQYPGAIGRLNTVIDQYPGSSRREEAFFLMAQSYRAVGDPEQARLALSRLLADYPRGNFAAPAQKILEEIDGKAPAVGALHGG